MDIVKRTRRQRTMDAPVAPAWIPHRAAWTTADELTFLKNIGYHVEATAWRVQRSWPEWLRCYVRTMERRHDWGSIDPFAVRRQIAEWLREAA